MGRRLVGRLIGHSSPGLVNGRKTPPEPGDGHLDDPVMTPLQDGMTNPTGKPHWKLHHLHAPRNFNSSAGAVGTQGQLSLAFEVAMDNGLNA